MSRQIVLLALIASVPAAAWAAARNFTDHQGNVVKGDFSGVKDGQVVLKVTGGTRKLFPLAAFSMDDREFVVEALKDPRQLKELMAYAVQNTVAKSESSSGQPGAGAVGSTTPGGVTLPRLPNFPGAGTGTGPGTTAGGNRPAVQQANLDMNLKSMYGISFPTEELMSGASSRTWTDLSGETILATFEKAVEPGLVHLNAGQGRMQTVPMVNLKREDIDYIRKTLETDMQTVIFPPGRFTPPGPFDTGMHVFTDRRGVQLTGKFKGRSGTEVTIEVGGSEQKYPFKGLSKEDRAWVEQEESRRSQSNSVASATPAGGAGGAGGAGIPGGPAAPTGPGAIPAGTAGANPYAGIGSTPTPTYTPPAMTTTPPMATAPPMQPLHTPGMGNQWAAPGGKPVYEFHCPKCGHNWTREGVERDRCPKCAPVAMGFMGAKLVVKILVGLAGLAGVGWGVNKSRG